MLQTTAQVDGFKSAHDGISGTDGTCWCIVVVLFCVLVWCVVEFDVLLNLLWCWIWCAAEFGVLLILLLCRIWCAAEYVLVPNLVCCWIRCGAEFGVLLKVLCCWIWCGAEFGVVLSLLCCWIWCVAKVRVMLKIFCCWSFSGAEFGVLLNFIVSSHFHSSSCSSTVLMYLNLLNSLFINFHHFVFSINILLNKAVSSYSKQRIWTRNWQNSLHRCTVYFVVHLNLIHLTWRIRWALINASRWQMGFNSVFKVLSNTPKKLTFSLR